ncbi:protein SERAC1 isoform X2 [Contarinia nasturtii]|nr:protein SERAC1 isoform X2 [Contarinia nasturtii]
MCNGRTAISLARHFSDTRWFLPPPNFGALRQPKSLISDIHDHLKQLQPNQCLNNFNSRVFNNFSILNGYIYSKSTTNGVAVTRQEYDFLRKCLEALYHLTQDAKVAETLLKQGFLQTLMEVLKLFHADINLRFLLAKIVANFTVCHEYYDDFFGVGWVGVLSRWTRNPDIRIQATAAKALANLDIDDISPSEYRAKIYPLYPLIRSRQKAQLDIIFIHGLLGGVFITWRQKDPKEPDLGLYESMTYSEDTLTSRKPTEKELKISDVATKEFLETLKAADVLPPDWEVVFPDCPIDGNEESNGEFSVSGVKWINDDESKTYTYCWPMDWLPQEFPNIRIIGLNYETSISEWSLNMLCPCEKKKSSLHDRSEELLNALSASNVGRDRPVIWVGHSMGGLVAKSIIVQSLLSAENGKRAIAENTRAILFLGTPHKGSPVAKLKQHVQMVFSPTIEVKELRENSQHLLHLQQNFEKALNVLPKPIKIVSIAEGCPTNITAFKFPMQFVTQESAKLDVGEFYVLNENHLGLSKPIFRQSFLYQRLVKIIGDVINTATQEATEAAKKVQNHDTGFEKLSKDHDAIM